MKTPLYFNDILTDHGADSLVKTFLTLYFAYLVGNMVVGAPEAHVSAGVHQTVGPCNVTDIDLAGHERQVILAILTDKLRCIGCFTNFSWRS